MRRSQASVASLLEYHGLLDPVFVLRRGARIRPQVVAAVDAGTSVTVREEPPAVGICRNDVTEWRGGRA